jgi:hypothetical protein
VLDLEQKALPEIEASRCRRTRPAIAAANKPGKNPNAGKKKGPARDRDGRGAGGVTRSGAAGDACPGDAPVHPYGETT